MVLLPYLPNPQGPVLKQSRWATWNGEGGGRGRRKVLTIHVGKKVRAPVNLGSEQPREAEMRK